MHKFLYLWNQGKLWPVTEEGVESWLRELIALPGAEPSDEGGQQLLTSLALVEQQLLSALCEEPALVELFLEAVAALQQSGVDFAPSKLSLLLAIKERKLKQTISLIRNNSYLLSTVDEDGNRPLHLALLHQDEAIARFLIHEDKQLDSANRHGETPLHIATRQELIASVQQLLARGAELLVYDHWCNTPLDLAIASNNRQLEDLFVQELSLRQNRR